MDYSYYSFTDPEGMEGWVGLVGWPLADALSTKWSHVNHGSGVDQGKSAGYRPDILTTEPRRQPNRYWLPITHYFDYCAPYAAYTRNLNTAIWGGVLLLFALRNIIIWTFLDDKRLRVSIAKFLKTRVFRT